MVYHQSHDAMSQWPYIDLKPEAALSNPIDKQEAILLLGKLRDEKIPVQLICFNSDNQVINFGGYITSVSSDLFAVQRSTDIAVVFTISHTDFAFTDPREAWDVVRVSTSQKYEFGLEFQASDFRCFIAGFKLPRQ